MNESIGYAKYSLDTQNRTAQRSILLGVGVGVGVGVAEDRIHPGRVTVYRVSERAQDMNAGVR
ncbi:hypothetical protein AB0F11_33755 [Streptomyces sp. NPDC032472]|uniref:hypothetical protein n=1 Tax=Streptomyces sp. NPDC032472 TaxID=3155018 RepID=UPI0034103524